MALESKGMWDSTTILLTSDHPFRLNVWRKESPDFEPFIDKYTRGLEVPFLLKLPGQTQGIGYSPAMQTVVAKDLLLAIMKGEITRPEQISVWLDHNPPRQ